MKTTRRLKRLAAAACGIVLLMACSLAAPAPTPTATPSATFTPAASPTPALECLGGWERRELGEPYQRDKRTNAARYTLTPAELENYLALQKLKPFCIPAAFGAPYLNVDWDSAVIPATGRMVSIGFEKLYSGGGWGRGFLVLASYNFTTGTEFDHFAKPDDWQKVQSGTPGVGGVFANGATRGIRRIQPAMFSMGALTMYEAWVFLSEDGYAALVLDLGSFDEELAPLTARLNAGDYPAEVRGLVDGFDRAARTIERK